jgi:5-(carboxyamino)imidazole ribonucleotide mutase
LNAAVGIIMGSQSDWPTLKEAAAILDELGVPYEAKIVSAHRTPDRLWDYGKIGRGARDSRSSSRVRAVRRICPA